VTVREVKTLKTYDGPRISKRVIWQGRVGQKYENQAAVKEKHESGEREKVGLPEWCLFVSPAIREHKTSGKRYLCFQPLGNVPRVEFEVMGKGIVSKSEIESVLLASEKRESDERPDWVTVGLDTVIGFK
jgi:hypothetical protein